MGRSKKPCDRYHQELSRLLERLPVDDIHCFLPSKGSKRDFLTLKSLYDESICDLRDLLLGSLALEKPESLKCFLRVKRKEIKVEIGKLIHVTHQTKKRPCRFVTEVVEPDDALALVMSKSA